MLERNMLNDRIGKGNLDNCQLANAVAQSHPAESSARSTSSSTIMNQEVESR